jgi:hypothetical protein
MLDNMTPVQFEIKNLNDQRINDIIAKDNNEVCLQSINIDSKKTENKAFRENYKKCYIKNKYGYNKSSCVRGDLVLVGKNLKIIVDSKKYNKTQKNFKFPAKLLNIDNFTKTSDTNIKYALDDIMNIEFISPDIQKYYENFVKNVYSNKTIESTSEEVKIGKIHSSNFIHLMCHMELGYAYREANLAKKKYLVTFDKKENKKHIKRMDFENVLSEYIDLSIYVDPSDRYVYLFFKENGETIYIMSKRKSNKANCGFLVNSKITTIESISND